MSFDLFKPFRTCFFCKGKKDLLRVVMGGYTTEFIYYHQECLRTVLADPETFFYRVDIAIHIQDELENENRKDAAYRLNQITRARELYSRGYVPLTATACAPEPGSDSEFLRVVDFVQNPDKIACKNRYDPSTPEDSSDKCPNPDVPHGRFALVIKS